MESKIQFLIMGGTIDSQWDGKADTAVISATGESIIPTYFSNLILYTVVDFKIICLKDSRQILREDLSRLLQEIENSQFNKIIITHGTYTMPDTAKYIKANLERKDQVIILTGSMVPLKGFEASSSDATFNLGYAVAKVEDLAAGVYLAMNGRVFDPNEVVKNLAEGKFFSVFEKKQ